MLMAQDLTVEEIKGLLVARFSLNNNRHFNLKAQLHKAITGQDCPAPVENPHTTEIKSKIIDWMSGLLAQRLKENCHEVPLISIDDFDSLFSLMLEEINKVEGSEISGTDQEIFRKFIKEFLNNFFESMQIDIGSSNQAVFYDKFWRWIEAVLYLAGERGILLTDFLALEDASDEINRHFFTREEFVANVKKGFDKLINLDLVKKMVLQSILALAAGELDEDDLLELEKEIEAEIVPQLRQDIERVQPIFNAWVDEEVNRIYGVE